MPVLAQDSSPAPFAALDSVVAAEMSAGGIPGAAVAIIHGDDVVYVEGYVYPRIEEAR